MFQKQLWQLDAGPGPYLQGWGSEAEVAHCCGSVRNSARLRAAGPPGWGGRWPGHQPTARTSAAATASFLQAEVPPVILEDPTASTYERRLDPTRQTRRPIRRWEPTSEPPNSHLGLRLKPCCSLYWSQNIPVSGETGWPGNTQHFISLKMF